MNDVTLSPRMHQIVILCVAEEMTYEEVARKLGISVHTVRSHAEEIGRRLDMPPLRAMQRFYWKTIDPDGEGAPAA